MTEQSWFENNQNRINHLTVIGEFLSILNEQRKNPYILKGGTALAQCYNLDRFSEDVDLDAPNIGANHDMLDSVVSKLCNRHGYTLKCSKDTDSVQRYKIHYAHDKDDVFLKIECSYRRKEIPFETTNFINGIKVYDINTLCQMKCHAYMSRDKIRDLYDTTFVCVTYWDQLTESTRSILRDAFEYKDLDQFDYLVRTQIDSFIDTDVMETYFLKSFELCGLMEPEARNKKLAKSMKTNHEMKFPTTFPVEQIQTSKKKDFPSESAR